MARRASPWRCCASPRRWVTRVRGTWPWRGSTTSGASTPPRSATGPTCASTLRSWTRESRATSCGPGARERPASDWREWRACPSWTMRACADISRAVETTLERGFGRNHGLCHGDLGNADFLLETARVTGDFELESRTYRLAGGILRGLAERGLLYGLQGNTETPGLMVGLAGTAYGLVRLSAPERVPSLLALASPSASHDSRMGGLGIREVVTPARIHKEQS